MENQSEQKKMIALIVEDDPVLAEIFSITFQLAGFDPIVTQDGKQAIKLIQKIKPEVITLDLHLPSVMGDDLVLMLKNDPAMLNAIIILTTADSRRASYLQEHVDFVFLKPISFSQLRRIASRIYQAASDKLYFRNTNSNPTQQGTKPLQ